MLSSILQPSTQQSITADNHHSTTTSKLEQLYNPQNQQSPPSSKPVIKLQLFPQVDETPRYISRLPPFPPIERDLKEGVIYKIGRKCHDKKLKKVQLLSLSNPTTRDPISGQIQSSHPGLITASNVPVTSGANVIANTALPPTSANNDITQASCLVHPEEEDETNPNLETISFRSKVVSRSHAELFVTDSMVFLRDTGSSSGTFLNKIRLAPSGEPSELVVLEDGDVLQFGVDYHGRSEDIYKCVVVRVVIRELDRLGDVESFNKGLHLLTTSYHPTAQQSHSHPPPSPSQSPSSPTDCCICLNTLTPPTALFVSPCSHTFHFHCVWPLLHGGVMFHCPLCRGWFNLRKTVGSLVKDDDILEKDEDDEDDDEDEGGNGNAQNGNSSSGSSSDSRQGDNGDMDRNADVDEGNDEQLYATMHNNGRNDITDTDSNGQTRDVVAENNDVSLNVLRKNSLASIGSESSMESVRNDEEGDSRLRNEEDVGVVSPVDTVVPDLPLPLPLSPQQQHNASSSREMNKRTHDEHEQTEDEMDMDGTPRKESFLKKFSKWRIGSGKA